MPAKHIHISFGVRAPIEDSLEVLATTKPPRATSCAMWFVRAHLFSPRITNQTDPKSYNSIHTID
jgi:hypothetical protein